MPLAIWYLGAVLSGLGLAWAWRKAMTDPLHLDRYPPNSPAAVALLEAAAVRAGVPIAWARHPAVHMILQRESGGGQVGIPNFTFLPALRADRSKWPVIWAAVRDGTWRDLMDPARAHAPSSATGLGQLIAANAEKYYPQGLEGVGDPLSEAVGLLAYLKDRWKDPDNLAAHYGVTQEGW